MGMFLFYLLMSIFRPIFMLRRSMSLLKYGINFMIINIVSLVSLDKIEF